ncbi:hypothetical protein [Brachybacterium sp. GPGPB12]|uniref:hypothetical protein n=1 Tax=Brachybacterium sp. GPGPB12 TaxID=3023517 RepID=UPI00313450E7
MPSSVVEHRTARFGNAQTSPGARFYYDVRNRLWAPLRTDSFSPLERVLHGGRTALGWLGVLARHRGDVAGVGSRGVLAARVAAPAPPRRCSPRTARPRGYPRDRTGGRPVTDPAQSAVTAGDRGTDMPVGDARGDGPVGRTADDRPARPAGRPERAEPFAVLMPLWGKDRGERVEQAVVSATEGQRLRPDLLILTVDGPLTPELEELVKRVEAGAHGPATVFAPQRPSRRRGRAPGRPRKLPVRARRPRRRR